MGIMKLTVGRLITFAAALFIAAMMSSLFYSVAAQGTDPQPGDAAGYYKAKCVACHGQKAEKRFDTAIAEDQMVDAVLKGKKAEKPPNMPGFEAKGVNADQAKALITYMKQLKDAPASN